MKGPMWGQEVIEQVAHFLMGFGARLASLDLLLWYGIGATAADVPRIGGLVFSALV